MTHDALPTMSSPSPRVARFRALRRTFLCAALTAAALPGCASDGATAPEHPDSVRGDGVTPEGLSDVRSELADRRSESRDLMDSTLIRPGSERASANDDTSDITDGMLGILGDMVGTTVDVLSLQAFGVW